SASSLVRRLRDRCLPATTQRTSYASTLRDRLRRTPQNRTSVVVVTRCVLGGGAAKRAARCARCAVRRWGSLTHCGARPSSRQRKKVLRDAAEFIEDLIDGEELIAGGAHLARAPRTGLLAVASMSTGGGAPPWPGGACRGEYPRA